MAAGRVEYARALFEGMSERRFAALGTGLEALLARLPDVLVREEDS